jgi:hypothetical protein
MAKRPNPWKKRVRVKGNRVVVDSDLPNLSETLLSFAKPLIDNLPDDPPSLDQIRQAMHFASIVWNVHILAENDEEFGAEVCSALDDVPEELGEGASAILDAMLEDRRTKYRYDRRFASVEVVEAPGGWNIVTEGARMD